MRVTIDGRDYVPQADTFRLTDEHFDAAAECSNRFEMIRWAHMCQAGVAEMRAWGRANRAEIEAPVPDPKRPLDVPAKKPKAVLF